MIGGRQRIRGIEAADGDVDVIGPFFVPVGQRGPAFLAKASHYLGRGAKFRRQSGRVPEFALWKGYPAEHVRPGCAPARRAMAKRRVGGNSRCLIAHPATETSAGDHGYLDYEGLSDSGRIQILR